MLLSRALLCHAWRVAHWGRLGRQGPRPPLFGRMDHLRSHLVNVFPAVLRRLLRRRFAHPIQFVRFDVHGNKKLAVPAVPHHVFFAVLEGGWGGGEVSR